jgi:hypothetical protein
LYIDYSHRRSPGISDGITVIGVASVAVLDGTLQLFTDCGLILQLPFSLQPVVESQSALGASGLPDLLGPC